MNTSEVIEKRPVSSTDPGLAGFPASHGYIVNAYSLCKTSLRKLHASTKTLEPISGLCLNMPQH